MISQPETFRASERDGTDKTSQNRELHHKESTGTNRKPIFNKKDNNVQIRFKDASSQGTSQMGPEQTQMKNPIFFPN